MQNPSHSIVFSKDRIQEAVTRLAGEVALWLEGIPAGTLGLICVLEGAKPFSRDLSAALQTRKPGLRLTVHEVKVQGTNGTSLLQARHFKTPFPAAQDLGNGPLLIVDDLVDSGLTLKLLKKELEQVSAGPVKTAVLIRKFGELIATVPKPQAGAQGLGVPVPHKNRQEVDFKGFDLGLDLKELAARGLKDYWLYGYGMDLDGKQRDLDHIGWMEIR